MNTGLLAGLQGPNADSNRKGRGAGVNNGLVNGLRRPTTLNDALTTTANYFSIVQADSPYGYWRMDATVGTTETDVGAGAHNGTYGGTYTLGVGGLIRSGNAVNFNVGHLDVGAISMAGGTGFTMECWASFAAPSTSAGTSFFDFLDASANARPAFFNIASGSVVGLNMSIGGVAVSTNSATIAANTVYHLVGTFDGTTVKMYTNGVLSSSVNQSGTIDTASASLGIGAGPSAWSGWNTHAPNVTMDEVAVYKYALSATQISTHYNAR